MNNYVSLHNHTTFSLLDGLYWPRKYVERAKELGMTSYAITDHGTMSGVFDFYDSCEELNIKPILGVEAYFTDNKSIKNEKSKYYHIILLAKNYEGYKSLLKAQYKASSEGFYYKPRIDWEDLKEMIGNVIVCSACSSGIIASHIINKDINKAEQYALKLKDMFKDDFYFEYIALERIDYYGPIWVAMRDLAKKLKIKSIISIDTHYLSKEDNELQDIMHNVSNKITIEDIKKGKGWVFKDRDLYLKSYDEVKTIISRIFETKIVEKYLDNTIEIDQKIEKYKIYPDKYVFPKIEFNEEKFKDELKKALYEKCPADQIDKYKERLNYEYKIVKKFGFLEYFWIVKDIVNWAKSVGIEVGCGRGSAGASLIVYLLGITTIDPLKFDLMFDRFVNPSRAKCPDIDVDFQQARRGEVLEYIKKYGVENISHIGNYVKLSDKFALKDVMRVYNISFKEANEATKLFDMQKENELEIKYGKYLKISKRLVGNIRQFSKHAAGIVITDKPLYNYIPVNRLYNEIISGIDGSTLSKKKFLKIDILGLDSLDIIQATLNYIRKYENKIIDINKLDLKDKNVYKLFQEADTDNIFQFKTYSFKELCKESMPSTFKNLIELNALNRPVSKSMNYHIKYIERKFGNEYYIPKLLKPHLEETYGLLLYQEQTIKILSDLIGLNYGEAENLRREIEANGFSNIIAKYYDKCYARNNKEDVDEALKELESMIGYTFNKTHATAYAMISYQMAYLKTYYRKYFNMAVLNVEQDEDILQKTIDDCYKHNIPIKDYNINEISYDFVLDENKNIIPGCKILKGIGDKSINEIIKNKPFKNVDDFLKRCKVRKNILEILYNYDFFKNAFGNIENKKIYNFLNK